MKFVPIGRNKNFDEEYANEFIQNNCDGKAKLISKKIVKKFVRAFFQTRRVEILYYGFPHVIDCRAGDFQLDIYQLYGEDAPHKPYETLNPFAVVSLWNIGVIAYAELKENGKIHFTPYSGETLDELKKEKFCASLENTLAVLKKYFVDDPPREFLKRRYRLETLKKLNNIYSRLKDTPLKKLAKVLECKEEKLTEEIENLEHVIDCIHGTDRGDAVAIQLREDATKKLLTYLINESGTDYCRKCVHLNKSSCGRYVSPTDYSGECSGDYCIEGMIDYFRYEKE